MDDMVKRKRSASGYRNVNTKLTKAEADYIREHYKPRCKINSAAALGRRFGIHDSQVCNIAHGKCNTHKD